jgi:hypothetical protein
MQERNRPPAPEDTLLGKLQESIDYNAFRVIVARARRRAEVSELDIHADTAMAKADVSAFRNIEDKAMQTYAAVVMSCTARKYSQYRACLDMIMPAYATFAMAVLDVA